MDGWMTIVSFWDGLLVSAMSSVLPRLNFTSVHGWTEAKWLPQKPRIFSAKKVWRVEELGEQTDIVVLTGAGRRDLGRLGVVELGWFDIDGKGFKQQKHTKTFSIPQKEGWSFLNFMPFVSDP